ncbi:MAG: SDR family NAD(P)-dependent oxidoreductase [Parvibaculaceae bacterium]
MPAAKVAIITGANGGMGLATVQRLARDGYRLAALDINVREVSELFASEGIDARAYKVDLTDEKLTRATIAQVEAENGKADVLVNLVGWTTTSRFVDETSDYWRKIVAVNFMSALYVTQAVLPGMIDRKAGRIVNVTSDAGRVGQSGEAVYAGMKGGLIAWSKSLARELARYNINVNCTAPGPTDTPLEHDQDPEVIQRIIKKIPFRRWAKPEDQAAAIAFLLSDDASYITGQVLSVSGGLTMN